MKYALQIAACLAMLLGNWSYASGTTITAEGRSSIGQDTQAARQQAIEDAIRNALIKAGGQVDSTTDINNGMLINDRIRLRVSGRVSNVEVLDEHQRDGVYVVNIRALVVEGYDCRSQQSNHYNRDVLITGFPREKPQSSQVGQLHNIDTDFSTEIARRLYPAHQVLIQDEPSLSLTSRTRYASPSVQASEAVKSLASKYQVQMVIAGSIVDLSMLYPEDYARQTQASKTIRKIGNLFAGKDSNKLATDVRARHFALRLVVYDGISGSPIFDKDYADIGIWDARFTEITGFGSPRFWQTAYGRKVSEVINEAVNDAGKKINCQPFMVTARLHGQAPGNRVYIFAGANHGVKIGDAFDINHRSGTQFPGLNTTADTWPYPVEYRSMHTEKTHLTITEVYPGYSIGTSTAPLMNGQHYIAVSW
ncbi:flagellar assembly protein T N-terminal domain-containing protein [Cellvibrio polysaccharolyticus]|uniref:Flagellar assembly T-like protein n=1 Tax=Cellvibrio polysaccharolyticus TaxID=2082724 RepID=A0A928V9D1_9GAMM|nr:flagellar assembly protein T N-terminal domain-containing protein [Cellvibrio polysaccharolyticus]MBE8718899.1 hypothetical protein [Cellvibrio polysaccharolyticus]